MEDAVKEYDSKHGTYQDQAPSINPGPKPMDSPAPFSNLHNPDTAPAASPAAAPAATPSPTEELRKD